MISSTLLIRLRFQGYRVNLDLSSVHKGSHKITPTCSLIGTCHFSRYIFEQKFELIKIDNHNLSKFWIDCFNWLEKYATVKPLITNISKEFIKCRILHFLIMECCRYLVF